MQAVAKAAGRGVFAELAETCGHLVRLDVPQAEFADAGRVDDGAVVVGQVVEPCRGGGMRTLAGGLGNFADAGLGVGEQGIDQRRLAHARLADEDAGVFLQPGFQIGDAFPVLDAGFDDGVAQPAVFVEQGVQFAAGSRVQQIDLVEHDDGLDAQHLGGHQVAIHQARGEGRPRGGDDQDLVDVGGNDFLAAMAVGAGQFAATGFANLHDAIALLVRMPLDIVTADQIAQLATAGAAVQSALLVLDDEPGAEAGDHAARNEIGRWRSRAGLARFATTHAGQASRRSMRAAQMKSFSDRPPMAWVV